MRIIESKKFDIDVTECLAFNGMNHYLIRYGTETTVASSLLEALSEFQECLDHAMQCEGFYDAE